MQHPLRPSVIALLFTFALSACNPIEGFGAPTTGGEGGTTIRDVGPSVADLLSALQLVDSASEHGVIIRLSPAHEYVVSAALPKILASSVSIEGRGATIRDGSAASNAHNLLWFENSANIKVDNICLRDGL